MSNDAMSDADYDALVESADKNTLWWALYRVLSALHCARAVDPDCLGRDEARGGLYSVVHGAADHWGPLIPGIPTLADLPGVVAEIAADDAYHALTYAAEREGIRITGDEFIDQGDDLIEPAPAPGKRQ